MPDVCVSAANYCADFVARYETEYAFGEGEVGPGGREAPAERIEFEYLAVTIQFLNKSIELMHMRGLLPSPKAKWS